jgi:hypothetical protein
MSLAWVVVVVFVRVLVVDVLVVTVVVVVVYFERTNSSSTKPLLQFMDHTAVPNGSVNSLIANL